MKRQLVGAVVALAVVSLGASACDVAPPVATANGSSISTNALNTQLVAMVSTGAGGCLLQLVNSQLTPVSAVGAGRQGTYSMALANSVLEIQVGDLLAEQYAESKGLSVSSSDLTTAASDLASTLNGEITAEVQQASTSGTTSYCQNGAGTSITGRQLLAGLPDPVRAAQIRNEAVDEKLLARGADLSDRAVVNYYAANQALFTAECLSVIATDTQAHANQLVAQLNAGASFADLAKANSLDSQTAPNGGSLGCNYTKALVEQRLQVQSIAVGRPITPVQDTNTGQWIIFEVTNQAVEPLSAAASVVRRELIQASANVTRVSHEIVRFARHSKVSIDPRYGTWKGLTIVAPVAPPEQYLLAAASGDPETSTGSSLDLNGLGRGRSSGTTGSSGSSGSPSTNNTTTTTTGGN